MRARLGTATACLLLMVSALAGWGGQTTSSSTALPRLTGYEPIPGQPLGPATSAVTETDGSSWSYDHPAAGKITLLYFGYTSCPDVCPTTMADLASALSQLPAAVRDKVWVQFVSTDPHRDTAHQIKAWLGGFDPAFHGGRAPIASVVTAARSYGVSVEPPKVTKGDYKVSHGAQLFVLDTHGGAVGYFGELVGSKYYADDLAALVQHYA